jgi:hypothetical protein
VARQDQQQLIFLRLELHGGAVQQHFAAGEVDRQVAKTQSLAGGLRSTA